MAVEFCYETSSGTTLSDVEINLTRHTTGSGSRTQVFYEATDRNDAACRLYTLATPQVLTAEDAVNFYVNVEWTTASAIFRIGRTTFVLEPTATKATPPSGPVTYGSAGEGPKGPSSDQ